MPQPSGGKTPQPCSQPSQSPLCQISIGRPPRQCTMCEPVAWVSVPVGGAGVSTGYAANMVLTDVATGRVMWTSKVTAPASLDVNAQIGQLAKAGVEAAQKAGLF